jgi:hypothetical protein
MCRHAAGPVVGACRAARMVLHIFIIAYKWRLLAFNRMQMAGS